MQSVLRWLTVLGVIGVVTAGVAILGLGVLQGPAPTTPLAPRGPAAAQAEPKGAPPATDAAGPGTLAAAELPPQPATAPLPGPAPAGAPAHVGHYQNLVLVPECHFNIIFKQEVPSQRDGQLLYVATEPKPGDVIPPDRLVEVDETYAYIAVQPGEKLPPGTQTFELNVGTDSAPQTKVCRRLLDTDRVNPTDMTSRVFIHTEKRQLRQLREGDEVREGDLLAMVDPVIAVDEYVSKATKVQAAKADQQASLKTRDEAEQRYHTMERLYNGQVRATVSMEDLRGAKLTWDRYYFEEISKREAIKQSEAELNAALTGLKLYEIRAKVSGVVKSVGKQRGEAVKGVTQGGDQIALINHVDRLKIEGLVDYQYISRLPAGSHVVIEPSQPRSPLRVLSGHLQAIKSVAVSKNQRIVSASEDSTRVWDHNTGDDVLVPTPVPTLSVACSPPADAQNNLLVTGGVDGVARVWNLAAEVPALVAELKDGHRGGILAVAFSPDGQWVATGGDDKGICLWNVNGQRLQGPLPGGHLAPVTSVKFLSQNQLVSAGKDNHLMVWQLGADGKSASVRRTVYGRGGDVSVLGVNPRTQQVLFDQGPELRLLSAAHEHIDGFLKNPGGGLNFTDMALFSPDGHLVLTNAASENRVQLWRLPSGDRRAYELRQLVWQGAPITCGAFAPATADKPQGEFVVTGTEDQQVVIWEMPGEKEITAEVEAERLYVEKALDTSSRQVRVWAEVDNKDRLLYPGAPATMVVYPPTKK
jgi:WD40 repeat protein